MSLDEKQLEKENKKEPEKQVKKDIGKESKKTSGKNSKKRKPQGSSVDWKGILSKIGAVLVQIGGVILMVLAMAGAFIKNTVLETIHAVADFRERKRTLNKRKAAIKKEVPADQRVKAWKKEKEKDEQAKRRMILAIGKLIALILVIVLAVFLIIKAVGAIWSVSKREKVVVEEVETESETELAVVYPVKDITVGATGSMLLHSPFINSYPDANGDYDFTSIYKFITPYYSEPDFMTCEFEGALAGKNMGYSGYPNFKSPDEIVDAIKGSGIDMTMLASNHIYDAWSEAFHRTMTVFEEKGVIYGGVRQKITDKPYYVADINGVKVGYINYVYETPGSGTDLNGITLLAEDGPLVNSFDENDLPAFYQDLQTNMDHMREDGARFIIANMHWGIEYNLKESPVQDQMAQKMCDMGVDAIIGGHPHCEQPIDVFTSGDHKMFCIFSVGNALSNQRTYLMNEMPTGHTEDGVMITLHLHQARDGKVSITDVDLLPTWVYRFANNGSKYYIFPLDDVENLETNTGVTGIQAEAQASYDRTMEELGPGLEKAKAAFYTPVEEPESESETAAE